MARRQVHELMNPDVLCARPGMHASEVLNLLAEHDIADAPVVDDDGHVIGVVSQSQLVRHVETPVPVNQTGRFYTDQEDLEDLGDMPAHRTDTPVEKIMSSQVYPITRETGVAVAANIMRERGVHRLFITDHGRLVGVITSLDLLRVVEELG
jgi:CBS domain-containing protein